MIDESDLNCCVCMHMFTNPIRLKCNHVLCRQCWMDIRNTKKLRCPLCRSPDSTHGRPHLEIDEIVRTTGRTRVCGKAVSDNNLRTHESTCKDCWKVCVETIQTELKRVMTTVLRTKAELLVSERRNKRKIDECNDLRRSNDDLRRKLIKNDERTDRRRRRNMIQ
jgi:hypothetical protein